MPASCSISVSNPPGWLLYSCAALSCACDFSSLRTLFIPLTSHVCKVHWVFGSKLQDQRVVLNDTELQLLHEDPPTGTRLCCLDPNSCDML